MRATAAPVAGVLEGIPGVWIEGVLGSYALDITLSHQPCRSAANHEAYHSGTRIASQKVDNQNHDSCEEQDQRAMV
jgi:hypothetical protein